MIVDMPTLHLKTIKVLYSNILAAHAEIPECGQNFVFLKEDYSLNVEDEQKWAFQKFK